MINDLELDRILADWLHAGNERAPQQDIAAALARVASMPQHRPIAPRRGRWWTDRRRRLSPVLVLAIVAVIVGSVAVAIVGGLSFHPRDDLSDPPPTSAIVRPVNISDWTVRLAIPERWEEIGPSIREYRHFAGSDPEGHLSASHEFVDSTTICIPECHDIDFRAAIPYSASAQVEQLKSTVAGLVGSAAWTTLPSGVLRDVEHGARLDSTATAADGQLWHRVVVVGAQDRSLVAIAWAQPVGAFDPDLLDAVLASIELTTPPVYPSGNLVVSSESRFEMPVPDVWSVNTRPTGDDGMDLRGIWRYGGGTVVVSIGNQVGSLDWCEPSCRVLHGQYSLDDLESTLRAARTLGPATPSSLGGEQARDIGTDALRYRIAVHDGRPVVVMVDTTGWSVAPTIVDQMLVGFRFVDPVIEQRFVLADGRVELGVSSDWQVATHGRDGLEVLSGASGHPLRRTLVVRIGSNDGAIETCQTPAAPWDLCRTVTARSLDQLVAAVQPAPIEDHGIGPPTPNLEEAVLDGEPAVVTWIGAYEYPAQGGQELVYIATWHAGRPYLIRIWDSDSVADLAAVIASFRFRD